MFWKTKTVFVNLFEELLSEKFNAFVGIEFLFSEVNTVNHRHKATENEK